MQVGTITVDGRQIGDVTQGDSIDTYAPLAPAAGAAPMAMPPSAPIGHAYGGHSHYSDHHAPTHHYAGSSGRSGSSEPIGDIPYSSNGNPFDRSRFAKELEEKPWLRDKVHQLAAGEDRPDKGESRRANMAVMETMMNRAVVRGTSLEKQAKWYGREHGGYYAGKPSHLSDVERSNSEENLKNVLAGSNITNYATDNSSVGLAAREKATGSFVHHKDIHGESFFSPGHAEPVLRDRWSDLHQKATAFEQNKATDTAANKPFDPGTMAP